MHPTLAIRELLIYVQSVALRLAAWIALAVVAVAAGCGNGSTGKPARPSQLANDVFSIASDGSGLRNLTDSPTATEQLVSVAPDGRTLAYFRRGSLIVRKGHAERTLDRGYHNVLDWGAPPAWSPDGQTLAVTKGRRCFSDDGCEHWPLWTINVKSGASRRIARDGVLPWWLPDGRLGFTGVFKNVRCECAAVFSWDPTALVVAGRTFKVGESPVGVAWGNLIAYSAYPSLGLYVMNTDGTHRRRVLRTRVDPALLVPSPDGQKLAFGCLYGRICVLRRPQHRLSRLGRAERTAFAWSRDSRFLAWVQHDIYAVGPSGPPRRVTHISPGARIDAVGWTGDGRIVFSGTGIRWH